ncbi:MAG TPA: hypothetical protein PLS73_13595 [Saprospiraceae bacterium]|nr:hypothetical protein [Saprospiraceae bacterium]
MIFEDKLNEKHRLIAHEIESLLPMAWNKQQHVGDLLLIHINGFFEPTTLTFNQTTETQFNPHMIGPGQEGHSYYAHYKYINGYRKRNIAKITHSDYLKKINSIGNNYDLEEELLSHEERSIQEEMLIYLKFWETDLIIKTLYQLVRVLHGEPYDWYFKICSYNRDKDCTGSRQDIIRLLVRDKLQTISPALYKVLLDTYNTQLRNAIAHSSYYFLGRSIHLNNFSESDKYSQISSLSFDDWIDIFHNTLILYNEFIHIGQLINQHYAKIVTVSNNVMEIQITEKSNKQYPLYVEYRKEWNDWKYVS